MKTNEESLLFAAIRLKLTNLQVTTLNGIGKAIEEGSDHYDSYVGELTPEEDEYLRKHLEKNGVVPTVDEPDKPRRGRTITLPIKGNPRAKEWVAWLDSVCMGSAGPHPNITGMRNKYWGKEALIVKAGAYIYLIKNHDDGRKMPWEFC